MTITILMNNGTKKYFEDVKELTELNTLISVQHGNKQIVEFINKNEINKILGRI